MGKAVLVIDMPKNCFACKLQDWANCRIVKGVHTGDTRPVWCPLREVPEASGSSPLLFDREAAMQTLKQYCDYTNEKELISVERALGFELTPQQIHFIATGQWRRTGKTTAEAIRKYLMNRGKVINLIPITIKESCEFREYEAVMRTLESAGLGDIKINKNPKRHTGGGE